jgi:Ni/Co efflux regulator RcnB
MKRLLFPAFALALVAGAPALAAPLDNANQQLAQNDRQGDQNVDRKKQNQPVVQQRKRVVVQPRVVIKPRVVVPAHIIVQPRKRYDWKDYHPGQRPPNWRQYQRNFNARLYQRNYNAARRYHWTPYQRPNGWIYRRWTFGQILPSLFWGRNYWVDRYMDYGLMDPPYGYVWVRYGDDALLVNVENGRILRVVYNLYE